MRRSGLAPCLAILMLLLPGAGAIPLAAQTVTVLIERAREHMAALELDSARGLLHRALAPSSGATPKEHVRAYTLLGVVSLQSNELVVARQYFLQALRLDPSLSVDSLADLQSDLLAVFEPLRPVIMEVQLTSDTILRSVDGQLPVFVTPNRPLDVQVRISSAEGSQLLWRDSRYATGQVVFLWPLQSSDSRLIAPGCYGIAVSARDSTGRGGIPAELAIRIDALADTIPLLPEPSGSDYLPDSAARKPLWPIPILAAAGAIVARVVWKTKSYDIGSAVPAEVAGGVIGAALGAVVRLPLRRTVPVPANVERNRSIYLAWQQERDSLLREHAANARVRVRRALQSADCPY